MKILHILDELKYSGAEVMLKNSAYFFINKNIELHALSTGTDTGIYAKKLGEAGFKIHHIPFRKTIFFFVNIYRLFKNEKFDVIHIHSERANFWYSFISYTAGLKKIVRTVHNVYRFKGYLKFKRSVQRLISSKIFRVKFISINNSVKQVEEEYFNNKTILIKNWVDNSIFFPPKNFSEKINLRNKWGISSEKTVIISIGNCSVVKNHFDIIKALDKLVKWKTNIIYLHVGEGESLSEEIALVYKLGIEKYVKFAGKVDSIREVIICCDIYVMTSQYEGSSIAILEASSCGLPLVIYDSPGLRESVIDGYNGLLVEPNHINLSDALKKLIENEELRILYGRNARKFVLAHHNMTESIQKLLDIYLN